MTDLLKFFSRPDAPEVYLSGIPPEPRYRKGVEHDLRLPLVLVVELIRKRKAQSVREATAMVVAKLDHKIPGNSLAAKRERLRRLYRKHGSGVEAALAKLPLYQRCNIPGAWTTPVITWAPRPEGGFTIGGAAETSFVSGCPKCAAPMAKIIYGMMVPTLTQMRAIERGEIVLGGCVVPPDNTPLPMHICPRCNGDPFPGGP